MLSNNSITSNYILNAMTFPVEPRNVFAYLNNNFSGKFSTLSKIYLVGILDSYYLRNEINGFEWMNLDGLTPIDLMDDLTILSIMKRKLNVPTTKLVQLIKKSSSGDYIYAGNTMYMIEK
jgi:hypothetical protein